MDERNTERRAIVIGGSIAGLLAARILADHFDQVIVIERDLRPVGPDVRKGAPQARHLHGLLAAGASVIESLLPGLFEEMTAEGADRVDMGRDTAWWHAGAWKPRFISGLESILTTRIWLEWKIRGRVAANPKVEIRYGSSVERFLTDDAKSRVTGVRVKTLDTEENLEATLVVDASGRGSRSARWLEELGYDRPEEEQVVIDVAYSSRFYERPAHSPEDWKFLIVASRPPASWRAGFIQRVEGGRWIVTLNGYFGDHPPADEEGFLEFARSLPQPDIHESIRKAKPLGPASIYKFPSSRWLHYERMKRLPEGLVLIGDAVCSFNPVFGQGMTIASLGAKMLGECLATQPSSSPELLGLSRRFQQELSKLLSVPWSMTALMDLKHPKAQGRRTLGLGLMHWAFDTLIDQTSLNKKVCQQFYEMMHMLKGPEVMLQPSFLMDFIPYGIKSLFVPLPRRANVDARPPAPS